MFAKGGMRTGGIIGPYLGGWVGLKHKSFEVGVQLGKGQLAMYIYISYIYISYDIYIYRYIITSIYIQYTLYSYINIICIYIHTLYTLYIYITTVMKRISNGLL